MRTDMYLVNISDKKISVGLVTIAPGETKKILDKDVLRKATYIDRMIRESRLALAGMDVSKDVLTVSGKKPADDGDKNPTDDGDKKPADDGDKNPTDDGDKKPADDGDKKPADDGDKKPADDGDKKPKVVKDIPKKK